jgi:hypothetical protein
MSERSERIIEHSAFPARQRRSVMPAPPEAVAA